MQEFELTLLTAGQIWGNETEEQLDVFLHQLLLEESSKPINTLNLFKKIAKLLELPESTIDSKIADYYTALATDKRFIMLEDGSWDLRSRHTSDKVVKIMDSDEDEEDEDSDDEDKEKEDQDEIEEDNYDDNDDDIYDDSDDDLKDLVVIDEEELELEQ